MMPGWSAHGGQTLSPYVRKIEEGEKILGHSVSIDLLCIQCYGSLTNLGSRGIIYRICCRGLGWIQPTRNGHRDNRLYYHPYK